MQLIHVPGFINRVVYNACKAYAGQLKAKEWYTKLTDVVAISICDFELWPDAEQARRGEFSKKSLADIRREAHQQAGL